MSVVSFEDQASEGLRFLERKSARRLGVKQDEARKKLASKWRTTIGKLERIYRNSIKEIGHRIYVAIQGDLRREEKALEHELAVYRAMGADAYQDEMAQVQKDLEAVRKLIDRETQ